jgi:hypothetical protein
MLDDILPLTMITKHQIQQMKMMTDMLLWKTKLVPNISFSSLAVCP